MDAQPCSIGKAAYTWFKHNNTPTVLKMTKQQLPFGTEYPSDIPEEIRETKWVEAPDLSRVRAVGFTDLMVGGKSTACSRLDWIEVYGSRAEH